MKLILVFDGFCNLCNGFVDFVMKRNDTIMFCAGQTSKGKQLLKKYRIKDFKSIVLIENNKVHRKSSAILRVFKNLRKLWPLLYLFIIIPNFIRDIIYDYIARKRYLWFGKKKVCRTPTAKEQKRFY